MKIFKLEAPFDKDGHEVFKTLVPSGYSNWYDESKIEIASGLAIRMKWCDGQEHKPEADLVDTPIAGLAFKAPLANKIMRFAPSARLVDISLDKNDGYSLLKAVYNKPEDTDIDHIFWMFNKHKRHLCTEKFKHWWESNGYTGMVFSEVDEMDDSLFKTV